jgi:hypothetical protein
MQLRLSQDSLLTSRALEALKHLQRASDLALLMLLSKYLIGFVGLSVVVTALVRVNARHVITAFPAFVLPGGRSEWEATERET